MTVLKADFYINIHSQKQFSLFYIIQKIYQ